MNDAYNFATFFNKIVKTMYDNIDTDINNLIQIKTTSTTSNSLPNVTSFYNE